MDEDYGFKFNIGEELTLLSFTTPWPPRLVAERQPRGLVHLPTIPQKMIVVEQHLVRCYGGIQRFYRVRISTSKDWTHTEVFRDLFEFTEPELIPYPEAITKWTEGYMAIDPLFHKGEETHG